MADDINYIDDLYRRVLRGPASDEVITLPKDYGPLQVDQSKIILEAYKQGLEPQIAQQKALEESTASQIKAIGEMKSPERSDLADAIMLLGAPLLGALGGEAGALSAPKAYAGASDIYEKQLKAAEDKAAAKRKLGYERLEEDKKRLATLGTEIAKGRLAGGEKIAEMEYKPTEEMEKTKRAAIGAQIAWSQDPRKVTVPPPIPGLTHDLKTVTTQDQWSDLKTLKSKYDSFNSKLNDLYKSIPNAPISAWTPDKLSEIRQKSGLVIAEGNDPDLIAKFGVLQPGDLQFMQSIVTTSSNKDLINILGGPESAKKNLRNLSKLTNEKYQNKLSVYGFSPEKKLQEAGEEFQPKKGDVKKLKRGTYTWDGKSWILQK